MIPVRLRLSGFLSYRQPAELDFSAFDLACISGANGAGKSSLLDAITWVLFGQARRRDDSLIHSRAGSSADVSLEFIHEGILYRAQRMKAPGKSAVLELQQQGEGGWRPLTEHSLRGTEERIQRILGLDYDTFINASFFLQGKADQFAQQRPGRRKEILGNILGLEVWEEYRAAAKTRRQAVETDLAGVDSRLEEIEAELGLEGERRARLKQLEEDLARLATLRGSMETTLKSLRTLADTLEQQRQLVANLETQAQTARQRRDDLAARLEERRSELGQYQERIRNAKKIEKAHKAWLAARAELERWEQTAANFHQFESLRSKPLLALEAERARLEQEGTALEAEQQAVNASAEEEKGLAGQTAQLEEQITSLEATAAGRPGLEAEQAALQTAVAELQAENRRWREAMNELKERIDRLHGATGADCPLCGQPLEAGSREALVRQLEEQGREMGDRYRANQEAQKQSEARAREIESALQAVQKAGEEQRNLQRQHDQLQARREQLARKIGEWEQGGGRRLPEVLRILQAGEYAPEARAELARVDARLQELGYDAAAHDAARKAEQEGRQADDEMRQLEAARAALGPLQREVGEMEQQLQAAASEVEAAETAWQQARARHEEESKTLPDLRQAELDLLDTQSEENRLRLEVGGARQAVDVLKKLTARKADLAGRREELARLIAHYRVLDKAFGPDGVPALLIEQALPEIESQANEVLDRLTAGGMSLKFETQREYRDRHRQDRQETLDILISDSTGRREYELFSGGEAFRINFAIRLALSRVLARRSGSHLQTLVIDEGFGSQDAEGRQRLIEAINLVRPDFAKILVITHLEELKDVFPARIEVEKTPGGSTLRVVA